MTPLQEIAWLKRIAPTLVKLSPATRRWLAEWLLAHPSPTL
jgi:hypothetical protein